MSLLGPLDEERILMHYAPIHDRFGYAVVDDRRVLRCACCTMPLAIPGVRIHRWRRATPDPTEPSTIALCDKCDEELRAQR